jgi:hypothetical protein
VSLPQILEIIQTGGTLAFALVGLWAFVTGRVQPRHVVEDRDKTIAYERAQKDRAFEMARAAQASHDRLANAVEARNRIEEDRVTRARVRRNGPQ